MKSQNDNICLSLRIQNLLGVHLLRTMLSPTNIRTFYDNCSFGAFI